MDGHLGRAGVEVHAAAERVLAFWFDELTDEDHFRKDPALDRTITERFGALRDTLAADEARGWRDTPATLLAAIIVLDQFSRNIFRDDPRAFAADPLALSLARHGVENGWHRTLPKERAVFLLMPFMHAEEAEGQTASLALFEELGVDEQIHYAREHAEVFARFGRFPSRNAALGRESTPEEEAYLSQPGSGW